MNVNAILYFVKYPRAGMVKTRLAKTIGDAQAAYVYQQLAEANFLILRRCKEADLIIVFDPPAEHTKIHGWLPGADHYIPQEGLVLGERLINAFQWAFDHGYQRVAAYGSDTLKLTTTIAEQGFVALSRINVVIGPAKDGGYYLIGLSSKQPSLFEGIDWSTSKVLSQTYQVINKLALKYHTLCPLEDLDELKPGGTHEFIHS
ncbi:MAG: TIGR04282 family arsenosugar biosynthesis glycosyltransferase [Candidatus Omnitrophica bacterium]|nr:TIGR04282 family arsenosugar biosynthesis glycosyltransferase [Candidatus Omnitrophota bacterium]